MDHDVPERADGRGEAADEKTRRPRGASPHTAVGVAGRMAVILACAAGVGLASAGCGEGASIDTAGGQEGATEPVGEAAQGLVSATACIDIQRPAAADVQVFDAQIGSPAPSDSKNFGASTGFTAGTASGQVRQALLRFDLSAIPSGRNTNVTAATLFLTQSAAAPTGPETINAHRVTSAWTESTVTFDSFAGGYAAAVSATFTNATTTPSVSLLAMASNWVQNVWANDGVLLESPTNATAYDASEFATVASRPRLHICWNVTCAPGFADCNNNGLDGCETNLATSAANCGACGQACMEPNDVAACVNGACAVGSCDPGFADCDHNPADGCEVATTSDPNNCGACGNVCNLANATSTCSNSACAIVSCSPGFADCDHNPANGCECAAGGGSLYHGWVSPIAGCLTNGYDTTSPTVDGGVYPYNAGDSLACKAWKLAATICKTQPQEYSDQGDWSCPSSGGFTDPVFGTYCLSVGTQYICSGCPGACNAACGYRPLSLRNCNGQETAQAEESSDKLPCYSNADCVSNLCQSGVCAAAHCADGVEDAGETGVDCGGSDCLACPFGQGCNVGADCLVGVCNAGVCGCSQNAECPTKVCNAGICEPPAPDGSACVVAANCASSSCEDFACRPVHCSNGVEDAGETGVDCGGGCVGCAGGQPCNSGADCYSGTCDGTSHCTVGLYHEWQSPIAGCLTNSFDTTSPTVDGGTYPYNAADSLACKAWKLAATICNSQPQEYSDQGDWSCPSSGGFTDPQFGTYCASVGTQYICSGCPGACNAACGYRPLSLRNCNGQETAQAEESADDLPCYSNADCVSNLCTNGMCAAAHCSDGVEDDGETGVDCGGGDCHACPFGQGCNVGSDCLAGVCNANVCGCSQNAECPTQVCNAGACAAPAPDGSACQVSANCASSSCKNFHCVAVHCSDGVQDDGETGVDCGGGICGGCGGGQPCNSGADCFSGTCDGSQHCTVGLYHEWQSPIAGCLTNGYDTTSPTVDGGTFPYNAGDSLACKAWKLAATICNAQPQEYSDQGDWSCPSSGGFTDPQFGTYCASVGTQYICSGCPGACNAACGYRPLSLRNCNGQETAQAEESGTGDACYSNADCLSNLCTNGVCAASHCFDGVQDDGETAVDCGGVDCHGCQGGQACNGGSDCLSGTCDGTSHCTPPLYHGWQSPIAGCLTQGYDSTAATVDGGTYPYNAADSLACRAWKLAATICNAQPQQYADQGDWTCPSSGGFTDPLFGTYCASVGTQYICSGCPGACNASCIYTPLSLRNCGGQETNEQ